MNIGHFEVFPLSWHVALTHTLLLVAMGMALEVVFTALLDIPKAQDWRLKGYTYIWMIPIYALVYPSLCWVYPSLCGFAWPARGLLYISLIYAVEYASGLALRLATGQAPWEMEYRSKRWAVHGLIRLDFAPAWFAASLLFELVFRVLRGLL